MNLLNPPEVADGGYWYILPIVPNLVDGGRTCEITAGKGWCAWYGTASVIARCPDPIAGLAQTNVLPASVLTQAGYSGKPYGRIGGQ